MKKFIEIPHLMTRVSNDYIFDISGLTLNILNQYNMAEDLILGPTVVALDDAVGDMSLSVHRVKSTSKMEAKALVLEDSYKGVVLYLQLKSISPVAAEKEAAKRLFAILPNNGNLLGRLSYNEKKSVSKSVLAKFGESTLAADIAVLTDLPAYIQALSVDANSFEEIHAEWEHAKAEELAAMSATEMRPLLFQLVNCEIIPFLEMATIRHSATYGSLARSIAELIKETNEKIKRSIKEEEEEEPTRKEESKKD